MRVISQEAIEAAYAYETRKLSSNTRVTTRGGTPTIYLWETPIAQRTTSGWLVTCGGWTSRTTISRLNDIAEHAIGCRPFTVKGDHLHVKGHKVQNENHWISLREVARMEQYQRPVRAAKPPAKEKLVVGAVVFSMDDLVALGLVA